MADLAVEPITLARIPQVHTQQQGRLGDVVQLWAHT